MKQIGRKIRAIRKENRITIEDLSKRTGISYITLHRYEKGIREPKLSYLEKIANALNTPIETLISNKSQEEENHE